MWNSQDVARAAIAIMVALLLPTGIARAQQDPAAEVLEFLLPETPKPNYGEPVPASIRGRVELDAAGGSRGIAGVSVTDGYSVVKTDADGAYQIAPNQSAVFIYITRPAGYDVVGHWYKPLAKQVEFSLRPSPDDEEEFTFVHVTDAHVSANRRSLVGLSKFVRELNAMTPRPRFVVNSGDLLNLHKALLNSPASGHTSFRNYVGIMNHLTMPCYNVAGDHTDSSYRLDQFPRGDHRCGKPMYWEYLGPHFFSFEYGKVHFVSVDFGYHLGKRQIVVNGETLEYPTNQVQPMHIKWLNEDMAHRSKGQLVVTAAEFDLEDHCPGFLQMARQHDIRMQLVGDIHVVSRKDRFVPYRVGGALAGCWWNPRTRELCPDLSAQGYMIYHVKGERLEAFYKGLGQRVAIVSHRLGAPWQGTVKLVAHVVQPTPGESLEYSLDGINWHPMREVGRPFYRAVFEASVETATVPDGIHDLAVRSTITKEIRMQPIVVANGDASSKYSTDASLTFTVATPTQWTTARAPSGKAEVLVNNKLVGVLEQGKQKQYTLRVPADLLRDVNLLTFRFADADDGITLTSPAFTYDGTIYRDPRDEALREIKAAHWGDAAVEWGGYIAGNARPPDETPFDRRQNVFCFVLAGEK
jgi:hypothetical protein